MRLIDADALDKHKWLCSAIPGHAVWVVNIEDIEAAPTVAVPASDNLSRSDMSLCENAYNNGHKKGLEECAADLHRLMEKHKAMELRFKRCREDMCANCGNYAVVGACRNCEWNIADGSSDQVVIDRASLDKVKEAMCDDFCKYPSICDEEQLMARCEVCPMNLLPEGE